MTYNAYQLTILARQHSEQLLAEAKHAQQVAEARQAKTTNRQSRKSIFLVARRWVGNVAK